MWYLVVGVIAFVLGLIVRSCLDSAPVLYDSTKPETHVVCGRTTGDAMEQARAMFPHAQSLTVAPMPGRSDLWKVTPSYDDVT